MQLNQAAAILSSAQTKHTLPILDTTAIDSDGSKITMIVNNTEIAIKTISDYKAAKFSCCVDTVKLCFALKELSNPVFTIKEKGLEIKDKKSRFMFPIVPYSNHPGIKKIPEGAAIDFSLIKEIKRVQYAAAHDDARFYLKGISVECDGENYKLVASNGHRLASWSTPCSTSKFSTIVPNGAIKIIDKFSSKDFSKTIIGSHIHCVGDDIELTISPLDAKYPDISKPMRARFEDIWVDHAEIIAALKVMSLARSPGNFVRTLIDWKDGIMTFKISGTDGMSLESQASCIAPDGQYAADLTYLLDMVSRAAVKDTGITIKFSVESRIMMTENDMERHLIVGMG